MDIIARNQSRAWPGNWFYFGFSFLVTAVVGYGFSHTIGNAIARGCEGHLGRTRRP